jgi:hypothetical protein
MSNHLFYGDNLIVLRKSIRDESVDLITLAPPSTRTRVQGHDLSRCPVKPLCVD